MLLPFLPQECHCFQADQPYGQQQLVMAAAAYVDGQPDVLVGGDVLQVTAVSGTSLLTETSANDHFLRGDIPGDGSGHTLQVGVVYEPLAARSERWYPAEKAWVDAVPGVWLASALRWWFRKN